MKRTFCCLFHASDCSEECEVVVERRATFDRKSPSRAAWKYRLVSYPASCKCGRPVLHSDPPQEALRRAYSLPEAEEM